MPRVRISADTILVYNAFMSANEIYVIKTDGTKESFNREKLRMSLANARASAEVAEKVIAHIEKELVGGMKTEDIYRHAFEYLQSIGKPLAARYSLRRSLLELGPTGFPFERIVAEIYKRKGFETVLDQTVQGKCTDHEVDVVAWNKEQLVMVEAKFHHELALKTDVKAALYIKARYDDVREETFQFGGALRQLSEFLLVTNTKFTEKAIQYCECSGVRLIGWNYPRTANLHHLIDETGVHPITCLTSLSGSQKKQLLEQGVVLCEQVREQKRVLKTLGFSEELIRDAEAESVALCPA